MKLLPASSSAANIVKTEIGMHQDTTTAGSDEEALQWPTDHVQPSRLARFRAWISKLFAPRPKRDAVDVLGFQESITRSRE